MVDTKSTATRYSSVSMNCRAVRSSLNSTWNFSMVTEKEASSGLPRAAPSPLGGSTPSASRLPAPPPLGTEDDCLR